MPNSVIWILILSVALPHVTETMFSPAVLAIGAAFNTSPHAAQWTISTYLMGYTLGTVIWGPIADKTGLKTTLSFAFIGFSGFSILCALSPDLPFLYAMRFASGACAAAASIIPQAYLLKHHTIQERAIISAKIGQTIAIGPAIGPTIGLYLLSTGPWQLLIIPIGITSVLLTILIHTNLMKDIPESIKKAPFDLKDALIKLTPYSIITGLSISTGFYFFEESRFYFTQHLIQSDAFYQYACWSVALCWFLGPFISEKLLKKDLNPLSILQAGAIISLTCSALLLLMSMILKNTHMLSLFSIALIFFFMIGTGMQIGNSITLALAPFKNHSAKASSIFTFINYAIASFVTYFAPYWIGSHINSFGFTYLGIAFILFVTSRKLVTA